MLLITAFAWLASSSSSSQSTSSTSASAAVGAAGGGGQPTHIPLKPHTPHSLAGGGWREKWEVKTRGGEGGMSRSGRGGEAGEGGGDRDVEGVLRVGVEGRQVLDAANTLGGCY